MKKSLLAVLLIVSNSSSADPVYYGNYTVSYDCGFVSGFGLMGTEPEGFDKVFASTTTVTLGENKLVNPSYLIKMSHKDENNQTCTVAGAGEQNEFHWYVSKNGCTALVKQPLSKNQFTECDVQITLKK